MGQANLTVVYGTNASGKSGFARLLKHACGARVKSDLLGDVFSDAVSEPSTDIVIDEDGESKRLAWTRSGGALLELRHVHVFDSSTASNYVNERNEATYETERMRFISSLVVICDRVSKALGEQKDKLVSALPEMPKEYQGTSAYTFFSSLTETTTQERIDKASFIGESERDERVALETTLKDRDIQSKLNQLEQHEKQLAQLQAELTSLKEAYSDAKMSAIGDARTNALAKRRVATEDAAKAFASAPIDGVGQES